MNECSEWNSNKGHRGTEIGYDRGELLDDGSYCSDDGDIVRDYYREWGMV